MTTESREPQTVSSFLRSYSPDAFEWEDPDYNPHPGFIWSRPVKSLSPGNFSGPSTEQDSLLCDGRSSPDPESLSDMSISLSDIGSGHYFATLPPMHRSRATSISAIQPCISGSDSRSLSDMSIASAATTFPDMLEDFESFAGNVSTSTTCRRPLIAAFPSDQTSVRRIVGSEECGAYEGYDDGLDASAIDRILEWTTSLFVSVASSTLNYSVQPSSTDDVPTDIFSDSQSSSLAFENEETCFLPCTKDSLVDTWSSDSSLVVKLDPIHQGGLSRPIRADPMSIMMPGAIDYGAINPEQPTTAKPVCMWGRRLERIPKVRLAGQKEAVYCFDSRKQRQKQKGASVQSDRHTASNFRMEQQQPTQVFYRARPLCSAFVRRDVPAAPVDAVKITQGQVLLQTITPVRFNSAPSQPYGRAQQSFQRVPFTSRTNGSDQSWKAGHALPPMYVKKIPGRGFL